MTACTVDACVVCALLDELERSRLAALVAVDWPRYIAVGRLARRIEGEVSR